MDKFVVPEKTAVIEKKTWANRIWPEVSGSILAYATFLADLFAEFHARDIDYCVLRNFEGLPDRVEGDIDILVRSADLQKAETTLMDLMEGFLLIRRVERNGHLQFYVTSEYEMEAAVRENRAAQKVQLDFVTKAQWKGIAYIDTERVLSERQWYGNFYVVGRTHRAAHLICHGILDKHFIKRAYKKVIEDSIFQEGKVALDPLNPFIGVGIVERLYSVLRRGDDAEILGLRKALILKLLFYSPQSILSCILFLIKKYLRITHAILFPPGVLIAIVGPDGAGKSTLLDQVGTVLSEAFELIKEQYMGWKQFILPTKRLLSFVQNSMADRRSQRVWLEHSVLGMRRSWTHNFSVLHYLLDLWIRYLFQIRPVLARGGLALCDRYFFDFLVQNVWICKNRLTRSLLLALTPTPTITILFTGDSDTIAARKHEVSPEETARQLAQFSMLKEKIKPVLELEATKPLDSNAMKVITTIFRRPDKAKVT